jgi:hypothetical protein
MARAEEVNRHFVTSINGVRGREYRRNVLFFTAMAKGKLAQLNVMIGGDSGRLEIWGNKGGIAFPSSQDERLIQAHYLYRNTDARSRNHCYRGKK